MAHWGLLADIIINGKSISIGSSEVKPLWIYSVGPRHHTQALVWINLAFQVFSIFFAHRLFHRAVVVCVFSTWQSQIFRNSEFVSRLVGYTTRWLNVKVFSNLIRNSIFFTEIQDDYTTKVSPDKGFGYDAYFATVQSSYITALWNIILRSSLLCLLWICLGLIAGIWYKSVALSFLIPFNMPMPI